MDSPLPDDIAQSVRRALAEDVGSGDLTAMLVPAEATGTAELITREAMVLCGTAWVDAVFRELDPDITLTWHASDGDHVAAGAVLCTLSGLVRPILTGERTALNFLQTLSGTATVAAAWANALVGSRTKVLDTRKTLPGLRAAQKYAVRCGGCSNHRMGLWDGILIKENHILAAGGITAAVAAARQTIDAGVRPQQVGSDPRGHFIEVEVENLAELHEAITAGADIAMLDNFSLEGIREATHAAQGRIQLEVSGNVTLERLPELAATGVDFISAGTLTKDLRAIDLSLRFRYNLNSV